LADTSTPHGPRALPLLIAIVVGAAALAGGLWLTKRGQATPEETVYEQKSRAARELIAHHAHGASDPVPASSAASGTRAPESRKYYLPPEVASVLFPFGATEQYDPWSYYRHKPNQRIRLPFAEHPGETFEWSTNSLGLREDAEVAAAHPDLRILVTGDSHTDGVCENKESYSNRLEAALQGERPGKTVEVLNAGNGGFSLYNYLGVLEKFLDLRPDAFVVGVYGGNDFREVLFPLAYFGRTTVEEDTPAEKQELERGRRLDARAMNQSFRSILGFRGHPEQVKRSVAAAVELVGEMQAICREHSIRMLCLYIPSPTEADWQAHADVFDRFRKDVSLTDADLRRESQMADEFLAGVRAAGTETLDAREALVAGRGPYFWNGEFHLNLVGHEKIAEALRARIASW
jgi:hypothetical protein